MPDQPGRVASCRECDCRIVEREGVWVSLLRGTGCSEGQNGEHFPRRSEGTKMNVQRHDCGHVCCDERDDPLHDHFLRPQDCPSCKGRVSSGKIVCPACPGPPYPAYYEWDWKYVCLHLIQHHNMTFDQAEALNPSLTPPARTATPATAREQA